MTGIVLKTNSLIRNRVICLLSGIGPGELLIILFATFMLVKLPRIAHQIFNKK